MKIEKVAVTELKQYHNNPRKGNVSLIADSLEAYGQYKPITVNVTNNEILAGNHTYRAAKQLGWDTIDVVYVDVDHVTAAKIVAIDNRASDMGGYDNKVLAELLDSMNNLEGSGYTFDEYDDLKAEIQEAQRTQQRLHGASLHEARQRRLQRCEQRAGCGARVLW